jgi:integrase
MRQERRRRRGRVNGPYQERGGWRVVCVPADGERFTRLFASEAKASRFAADLRAELNAKDATLTEAIDLYLGSMAERGLKVGTIKTAGFRLRAMFDDLGEVMVGDLSPKGCQAAYDRLRAGQKADTHRNTLALAKAFLGWCAKQGYAGENAMEDVEGKGERSVGKEQLRIDEARRLMRTCLELAMEGDAGALATLVILLLGIRASECAAIAARDIDDEGRLLWIPVSKTRAGIRRLVMPPDLGKMLAAQAGDGRAFPDADRYWVHYHVKRLCKLAKVPEVSPHGLRGTHASLAVRGGASSEIVAASLGHTSTRITERHYTREDATAEARSMAAQRNLLVLKGGK